MTSKMSKQVMRKVMRIQKFSEKYYDPKERKRIPKRDKDWLEKTALEILEVNTGKLDAKKLPKNPVDRAMVEVFLQNRER